MTSIIVVLSILVSSIGWGVLDRVWGLFGFLGGGVLDLNLDLEDPTSVFKDGL